MVSIIGILNDGVSVGLHLLRPDLHLHTTTCTAGSAPTASSLADRPVQRQQAALSVSRCLLDSRKPQDVLSRWVRLIEGLLDGVWRNSAGETTPPERHSG